MELKSEPLRLLSFWSFLFHLSMPIMLMTISWDLLTCKNHSKSLSLEQLNKFSEEPLRLPEVDFGVYFKTLFM